MAGDIRSTHAVRLGLRQIKGFREDDAEALVAARGRGYDSVRDLWLRSGLGRAAIERLADGDAFRSLGLDRRDALWAARELGARQGERAPAALRHRRARRHPQGARRRPAADADRRACRQRLPLSQPLAEGPPACVPARAPRREAIIANEALRGLAPGPTTRDGKRYAGRVTVAGLVLIRQRPGTASGVIFMTLEDETDIANIIVWPKMFEQFRPVVLGARLVAVTGKVQSESGVIHVIADRLEDLTPMLGLLSAEGAGVEALARADEVRRPSADMREKIGPRSRLLTLAREEPGLAEDLADLSARVMPKGRNFH